LFLFLVLQRTCELIKDSSLWRSNFIPSVRVSFINVESGFSIKNLNFSFLGANIPILFVGSQSVSVEVRIIWYQSQGSKIRFTILLSFVSCYHLILFHLCSLFLILVIILSCFVCIDCSLFLFCFVHQVKKKKLKKKKEKRERRKKKSVTEATNTIIYRAYQS